ncbi:13275_t:CDS:2 [Acaulospora morrowiae]|uniref:Acetyltransferase n=1 Tax=Acaulospora morrowiae TaxID=94023 RepID=A0A9N8WG94_9GLOM|nr:13275_t:CDS:2 [Acaulospora morrowiae]
MFGPNVQLYAAKHPVQPEERANGKKFAFSIKIGNDVWIGGGTIICPRMAIGNEVRINISTKCFYEQ